MRLRRVVAVVVVTVALMGTLAGSAQALPGVPDCRDAPVAAMPGDGVTGFFDGKPAKIPPAGDPFAAKPTTSVYEQYGYAGLTWHTYDLGTAPVCVDVATTTDTMLGNWAMGLATVAVSAANGLHNKIAHPATYMAPLDSVVARVSAQIKAAVWDPWGAIALLALAGLLLWRSASGRLASVAKGAGWAVVVVAVMAGLAAEPVKAAGFFDDTVTGAIAQVDAASAGLVGTLPGSDPATAQGALVVDRVLYDSWLRGMFGTSTSATARTFGPRLFRAQAFTWAEAAQPPDKIKALADQKATAWKTAADELATKDPAAYLAVQGKTDARKGVGAMAAFGVAFTNLFRVLADFFVFAGLVMLRFLVMFAPAVAVLAVFGRGSSVVKRVLNLGASSVVNVVAFSAGSAVQTTVVAALLGGTRGGGLDAVTLVLCAVATVVALVVLWPMLSLTRIVGVHKAGGGVLRKAVRLAGKAAGAAVGGAASGAVAAEILEDDDDDEKGAAGKGLVAESFSREDQTMNEPHVPRAVGVAGQDPPRRPREPDAGGREPERWVFDPATGKTVLSEPEPEPVDA
jgi:hypothetical protein